MKNNVNNIARRLSPLAIGLTSLLTVHSALGVDVNFDTKSIGWKKSSELWTVGTSYVNESAAHIGNTLDAMRFGAVQEYPMLPGGLLTDEAKAEIDGYVEKLNLLNETNLATDPDNYRQIQAVTLMGSSSIKKVDPYFVAENGTDIIPERWRDMFVAYVDYIENVHGLEVLLIEPGNETDYGDKYKSKDNWRDIHDVIFHDPILSQYPIVGPSTLSAGSVHNWWPYVKDNTDWGATHVINGTMNQYVDYLEQVANEGKPYFASENHSLAEMIICANYGCLGGLWWRTSDDKGDWSRENQVSRQIAYVEDRPNWTVATAYKQPNKIWLFASGGTRATSNNAVPTTYTFRSEDRDVYFDGVGPQREFTVEVGKSDTYAIDVTWDTQPDITSPDAPVNLAASVNGTSVALDWDDVNDESLAGYVVMRKHAGEDKFDEIATDIVTSSYSDTDTVMNMSYEYKVVAFDTAGNQSTDSAPVNVTVEEPEPIVGELNIAPTDDSYVSQNKKDENYGFDAELKYKGTNSKARHTYLKFDVDSFPGVLVSATLDLYNRYSVSDATLHTVQSNEWNEGSITWNNRPDLAAQVQTLNDLPASSVISFDVTAQVQSGETVSFAITTSHSGNTAREFRSKESNTAPVLRIVYEVPPPAPQNLLATPGAGTLLSWEAVEGALQYNIYESVDSGPYTKIAESTVARSVTPGPVSPTAEYRYAVTAIDEKGLESEKSESAYVLLGPNFTLAADTDFNGVVNTADGVLVQQSMGATTSQPDFPIQLDYNGNGVIDISDYRRWVTYYRLAQRSVQ